MKISGYKNRDVSTFDSDSKLAFDLEMSLSNTTGEALFGISGFVGASNSAVNSRKSFFTLKSGKVFDPENRCVYSYQKDVDINLKGTFLPTEYDYFINNNLVCTKGAKDNFKIRNFFFDSDGCEINLKDLDLYGVTGSLDLEENITFEVFGTSGSSGGSSGNSGKGDTITFSNALTFNSGISLVGGVLSGEVTMGNQNFSFDNTSSNITSLTNVAGGGTKKDLKLIAQGELSRRDYPVSIDFHTSFGTISRQALARGVAPQNPSGIFLSLEGDGQPLNSGGIGVTRPGAIHQGFDFATAGQGEDVSGIYSTLYSVDLDNITYPENKDGLPYKIYLEHVSGSHVKKYAFVTGILISGGGDPNLVSGGLGYSYTDNAVKQIALRSGDLAGSAGDVGAGGTAGLDGASFGLNLVSDHGVGLVSTSDGHLSEMLEAHISSIATNLYTGEGGDDYQGIVKTNDGTLITSNRNVADVAVVVPYPSSSTAATKISATGIAEIFSYTKPASDWRLYISEYGEGNYVQQTQTGISDAPTRYHIYDGTNPELVNIAVMAKNYVDTDPMIYRLVLSGADGFESEAFITGTVMDSGPFDTNGNFDGVSKYTPIHPLTASL